PALAYRCPGPVLRRPAQVYGDRRALPAAHLACALPWAGRFTNSRKPMTAVPADDARKKKRQIPGLAQLQRVGRSLMLPIAVLPAAALLQRFGQPDMLGADGLAQSAGWLQPVADTLGAAGSALFDNLQIIFAVGVAIGFAKK